MVGGRKSCGGPGIILRDNLPSPDKCHPPPCEVLTNLSTVGQQGYCNFKGPDMPVVLLQHPNKIYIYRYSSLKFDSGESFLNTKQHSRPICQNKREVHSDYNAQFN